jgi:mono/diheme cytochrome c family protein
MVALGLAVQPTIRVEDAVFKQVCAMPEIVFLIRTSLCGVAIWTVAALAGAAAAESPLLEPDVLPILTKNCMGCHGGLKQEGGLDLRTIPAMLRGGESGAAITPSDAEHSTLWQRIAADEMPEGKTKLSPDEKATIKAWIEAGLPTLGSQQQNVAALLPADRQHAPQEVAKVIDHHVNEFLAAARLEPAARSDDAEFLRRIYLDLTGRTPSAEQALAFLDDTTEDKRARLIDTLLASPAYGDHFGRTWRDWICPPELPSDMNSGKQPHNEAQAFGKWLGAKFAAGEPWSKITRDILTVQGEIKNQPQVIFFGLVGQDGKATPDGSARAVASLFMGVQLQCAQCHDDPYRAWSQQEHWALAAFFGMSQGEFNKIEVGKGPSKKPGELAIPPTAFKNSGSTVTAAFLGANAFETSGEGDLRKPLVNWLTAKENPYFAKSFANRLWFQLLGRGLVHPVDDMRELNPPSHPGLLKLLAGEFAASNYDIKHLVRCICNSQVYQRTSRVPSGADAELAAATTTAFGQMPLRLMNADMLYHSLQQVYGDEEFDLRPVGTKQNNTAGESAPVGSAYLEFQRLFGTSEENAADFTHGIPQMLTMLNHPRLLGKSQPTSDYLKENADATPETVVEWLYLSTLSRRPTEEEAFDAVDFVNQTSDRPTAYVAVLWMLANRTEYLLVR